MMKKIILFFTIFFSGVDFGQEMQNQTINPPPSTVNNSGNKKDLEIFGKVDKNPVFAANPIIATADSPKNTF